MLEHVVILQHTQLEEEIDIVKLRAFTDKIPKIKDTNQQLSKR